MLTPEKLNENLNTSSADLLNERLLGGLDFTQIVHYYDDYLKMLEEKVSRDVISTISEYLPYACSIIWFGAPSRHSQVKGTSADFAFLSQHPKFAHFLFQRRTLERGQFEGILNIACRRNLSQTLDNICENVRKAPTFRKLPFNIHGANIRNKEVAEWCMREFKNNCINLLDGAVETNNAPLFNYLVSVSPNSSLWHTIEAKRRKKIYEIRDPNMLRVLFKSSPLFKNKTYNLDEIVANAPSVEIVHSWYYELGIKKERFTYSNSCIDNCSSPDILDFLFLILNANFCYTSAAVDGASQQSNIGVLNWWLAKHKVGDLELKYTVNAVKGASATAKKWWNESGLRVPAENSGFK